MTAYRATSLLCLSLTLTCVVTAWTAMTVMAQESGQPPTFYLCEGNIAEVSARQADERFLLTVRLTEAGTEHWAAFTTEHLARHVRVKVGSVLLVEAQIQATIPSGLIEIARSDSGSAETLREATEAAPASPCGASGSR